MKKTSKESFNVIPYQSFSISSALLRSSPPLCCVMAISACPLPPGPLILMNSTLTGPLHQPMDTLRATLLATLACEENNQTSCPYPTWVNQLDSRCTIGCNTNLSVKNLQISGDSDSPCMHRMRIKLIAACMISLTKCSFHCFTGDKICNRLHSSRK